MDELQSTKRIRLMPYIFGGLLGISLGLAILSGVLFLRTSRGQESSYTAPTTYAAAAPSRPVLSIENSRRNAIVVATETVAPAVVTVTTTYTERLRYRSFFFEDWFKKYYSLPQTRTQSTLGSGVIIDGKGYILTNEHVISKAEEIKVTLSNGEMLDGALVASAPEYDLALLKVEADHLPFAQLGDSDSLLVGEWVIAIGSPFGTLMNDPQPTVTVGVVSALHRDVNGDQTGQRIFKDMIQTDASINPGNSGGPLINSRGEVIGINTFIFSSGGGSIGMGFAIPVNRGKWVLEEMVNYGRVRSIWVGISAVSVTPEIAVGLNLDV
ncbi:MAG: trypsin-like peptidase domain-containing protein, partial [Candidatus Latescibacterota bacterium]